MKIKILPILTLAFLATTPYASSDESDYFAGIFLGVASIDSKTEFSYGIEYEYKLAQLWGAGLLYEKTNEAHHGNDVNVTLTSAYIHPWKGLRIGSGVGQERVASSHRHTEKVIPFANRKEPFFIESAVHYPFVSKEKGFINEIIQVYNASQDLFSTTILIRPYKRAIVNMKRRKLAIISTSKSLQSVSGIIHLPMSHLVTGVYESVTIDKLKTPLLGLIRGEEDIDLGSTRGIIGEEVEIHYVPSYFSMFKMIASGRLTYGFCGLAIYEDFRRTNPDLMENIKIKGTSSNLYAGITLRKAGNQKFINSFILFFKKYSKSKEFKELNTKYFGKSSAQHYIKNWKPIEN